MHTNRTALVTGMRWALLAILLLSAGLLYAFSEGSFDRLTRPFCPDGWWRTGAFWAHCAYPPMSISKYGAMYASFAALALGMVYYTAPRQRQACSRALLLALMLPPAFHLLFVQFSWVETARLGGVLAVGLLFETWTRLMRRNT